jgi:hypothetical protein
VKKQLLQNNDQASHNRGTRFAFPAPTARQVSVAGDFNDWTDSCGTGRVSRALQAAVLRSAVMKTDTLIQPGAGRPKKMPLMEVECPADNAAPTSATGPKLLVIRDAAIKDLISKIELILPDVAGASQELSTLRRLLEEQLADAAALNRNLSLVISQRTFLAE